MEVEPAAKAERNAKQILDEEGPEAMARRFAFFGYSGVRLGLYGDNVKEDGNYYFILQGFGKQGLGFGGPF